ncbi:hypothetical protein L4D15_00535 [Enterovibrio norvegicus]|uniref:hypothetical protein n=1 Tax=Enterovibrio norvegicus TaxID=188144 RepID=UPI003D0B9323
MSIFVKCKVAVENLTANISDSISAILARVNWLYVRLIFIAAGVVSQFFASPNEAQEAPSVMWQFVAIAFIFGIVGLQLIIGAQAFNPMSAKVWLRPAWKYNPFSLNQPLQFFHFCGWFMLAGSLPYLPAALEGDEESVFLATMPAAFGLGLLVSVRLSVLIYRRKFA